MTAGRLLGIATTYSHCCWWATCALAAIQVCVCAYVSRGVVFALAAALLSSFLRTNNQLKLIYKHFSLCSNGLLSCLPFNMACCFQFSFAAFQFYALLWATKLVRLYLRRLKTFLLLYFYCRLCKNSSN